MAAKLVVQGGTALRGDVRIPSAAKNAALPVLCAALLTAEPVTLENVPALADVDTTCAAAAQLGRRGLDRRRRQPARARRPRHQQRGALRPGQDDARLHAGAGPAARALRRGHGLAARRLRHRLAAGRPAHQGPAGDGRGRSSSSTATSRRAASRLKGARITIDMVTVTGTENLLMAAALAEGDDRARERRAGARGRRPGRMLIAMGARIEGAGTEPHRDRGRGRARRRRAHRVMPDRIEAGTFLCAVAATGGDVMLRRRRAAPPRRVIDKLRERRRASRSAGDASACKGPARPRAVDIIAPASIPASRPTCRRSSWRCWHRRRHGDDHRDDLREPLHARERAAAAWARASRSEGNDRGGARRAATVGRDGDGHRPARLGQPGDRRPGGRGETGSRPHLPPRPRLRADGSQAARARRRPSSA